LNTIFDGVNVVQIAGLGVLALLPLVTFALVGFACGQTHRWDFVEGLAKAVAALTFTLNVCVVAWFVLKFYHGLTLPTVVTAVLAAIWYFYTTILTLNQSPTGRRLLQSWSNNVSVQTK